jgi:hypothetical protein
MRDHVRSFKRDEGEVLFSPWRNSRGETIMNAFPELTKKGMRYLSGRRPVRVMREGVRPISRTKQFGSAIHELQRRDEYSHATIHCKTLYKYSLLILIRAFPSEGRTTWVRRYCNISKGSNAYCTTCTSRYVLVRTVNLTCEMTRQARFPM